MKLQLPWDFRRLSVSQFKLDNFCRTNSFTVHSRIFPPSFLAHSFHKGDKSERITAIYGKFILFFFFKFLAELVVQQLKETADDGSEVQAEAGAELQGLLPGLKDLALTARRSKCAEPAQ